MTGGGSKTIKSPLHAEMILHGYNELRKFNHVLCDCTLILNNSKYPVHKSLLAASSSFFKALFSSAGSWKESSQADIMLNDINEMAFEVLLEYVYTGTICLSKQNVYEIHTLSDMLQFQHLKDICHDYLVSQICTSNIIEMWKHAVHFNDYNLQKVTWQFIMANLKEIIFQAEFHEKVDRDSMAFILSYWKMACGDSGDQEIISAVAASTEWINGRSAVDIVQEESTGIIESCQSLKLRGTDMSNSFHLEAEDNCDNYFSPPLEVSLVVAGGYNEGLIRISERLCTKSKTWGKVTNWNLSGTNHYHWVGVLGVRLYALRGDNPIFIDTMVSMLTPQASKQLQTTVLETGWEHECTLSYDCSNMKFLVMCDNIYSCGITQEGTTDTDGAKMKIHRYSPNTGLWTALKELESDARVFFQFESYQGQLLILGGLSTSTQKAVPFFQAYTPTTDRCENLRRMICPRYNFGTAVLDNCLYAVGGYGLNERLMHSVEKYHFGANIWSHYVYLPSPRACMACHSMNGVLYCVGGEEYHNGSTSLNVDTLSLGLQDKKWVPFSTLTYPRCYPNVVLL